MQSQPRPFISYAHEDRRQAIWLYGELRRIGAEPWLDEAYLVPGADWSHTIRQALTRSTHFIALISRNSVNKRGFVQRELMQGLELLREFPPGYIYLIPVRLEDVEPAHDELKQIHRVDMFRNPALAISKIAASLGLDESPQRRVYAHEGREELEIVRQKLQKRLEMLEFPRHASYDGFVINYELEVGPRRTVTGQGLMIQGLPSSEIPVHVELIETEIRRRGPDSTYAEIQDLLPTGFKLSQIDLRVIFDHRGAFAYLQHLDGQVMGPDNIRRPLRRVLEKGD